MTQSVLNRLRLQFIPLLFCLFNTLCIVWIHIIWYKIYIIARCISCEYGSYLYDVFRVYICVYWVNIPSDLFFHTGYLSCASDLLWSTCRHHDGNDEQHIFFQDTKPNWRKCRALITVYDSNSNLDELTITLLIYLSIIFVEIYQKRGNRRHVMPFAHGQFPCPCPW